MSLVALCVLWVVFLFHLPSSPTHNNMNGTLSMVSSPSNPVDVTTQWHYITCEILSGFPIFPPKLWENSGTESLWVTVVHTTNASGKHRSNVNGLLTFFMPGWEYVPLAWFILKTWEHLNVRQHCLVSCWWAGGLAHMVERSLSVREVPRSMPGSSTFVVCLFCCCCCLIFSMLVFLMVHIFLVWMAIFRSTCSGLIATASGDDTIRIFQEVCMVMLCVLIMCTGTSFPPVDWELSHSMNVMYKVGWVLGHIVVHVIQ